MTVRWWLLLLLFAVACGGEPLESVDPNTVPEMPTWRSDVRPMLDRYCQGCHSAATLGGAPDGLDFSSYTRTVCEWEEVDETAVRERSMPPGGAPRLSAREIGILKRWADIGHPSGDGTATPAGCGEDDD